jgi:type II secretory pathway pseudopilin PulG
MNAIEDHSTANLALLAPILDEAVNELGADDRTAILLRFFEQRDFQSVGVALGSSEEAARKRVERALDKLETLLKRRGVAFSAAALATTLSTQAVTAAPVGLAMGISTVALTSAAGGGTTLTILKTMSMTKLKVGAISAIVVASVAIPLTMQQRAQTRLREANEALRALRDENRRLTADNAWLSDQVAQANQGKTTATDPSTETLRLRGEVSRLRQDAMEAETAAKVQGPSALSGLTTDPEMWKLIRDQQKAGMSQIYNEFTNRAGLPQEQANKLVDILADDIMTNIDLITMGLREGKTDEEMNHVFAAQEAALLEKVKELLGPEVLEQYRDYTLNLASYLTAEQFKSKLTGDKATKDSKSKQLYQMLQEETRRMLASAGLPQDFQTVPTLNFRNIASEEAGEKNLKLLDDIYASVMGRADSFLSPEEIAAFGSFRTNAINANRMALSLNRKMMAPAAK